MQADSKIFTLTNNGWYLFSCTFGKCRSEYIYRNSGLRSHIQVLINQMLSNRTQHRYTSEIFQELVLNSVIIYSIEIMLSKSVFGTQFETFEPSLTEF